MTDQPEVALRRLAKEEKMEEKNECKHYVARLMF